MDNRNNNNNTFLATLHAKTKFSAIFCENCTQRDFNKIRNDGVKCANKEFPLEADDVYYAIHDGGCEQQRPSRLTKATTITKYAIRKAKQTQTY